MDELQTRLCDAVQVAAKHPFLCLGVAAGTAYVYSHLAAPRNLPPGPPNYPFIGAVSCIDMQLELKMFAWRKTYGNIISYYKSGKLVVVLNDEKTIREAFVKQADGYNDRDPSLAAFFEVDFTSVYTEEFKNFKKFLVSSLKQYGFGTPKSEQTVLTQFEFLEEVINKTNGAPMDFNLEMRQLAANVILSILAGGGSHWDDPDTLRCVSAVDKWYTGMYKAYGAVIIVGMLPYIPLKMWLLKKYVRRIMRVAEDDIMDFCENFLREHAVDIASREPQDVADHYLKEKGSDEATIKKLALDLMVTLPDSIDSNCNLQRWLLQYVMADTALQATLHKEIDDVLGARKPTMADRDHMPWIQGTIHEILRLIITTPMSVPRLTNRNLTLNGYNIPKGTEVLANLYGIHNDPEIFPEPDRFKPARYIGADGKFDNVLAGRLVGFGVGPRKCAGETYIKGQIFLFLTRILQLYRIEFDPSEEKPANFTAESSSKLHVDKPGGWKMCFHER